MSEQTFSVVPVGEEWACPKGHRILQSAPFTARAFANNHDLVPAQPVCQQCYVEWMHATFPISKYLP